MFHRVNAKAQPSQPDNITEGVETESQPQQVKTVQPKYREQYKEQAPRLGLEQSAVERYAKTGTGVSEENIPTANQNATAPYAIKTIAKRQPINQFDNAPENQVNSQANIQQQEIKPQEEEDAFTMNTEATQSKTEEENQSEPAIQNRSVEIPGNNFGNNLQRPANRTPGSQPSRPAYPGTYGSTPSYGARSNDAENDRKLVIGQGITLSGEIESCDHLIVEGTVEAALKGANMMDVSETGAVFGTVEIEEAIIAGRFEGDIIVNGRLTVRSTGIVMGTISYGEIAIEAGATLEGSISPLNAATSAAKSPSKKTAIPTAPAKSKKVQNVGEELPFADKTATAAE